MFECARNVSEQSDPRRRRGIAPDATAVRTPDSARRSQGTSGSGAHSPARTEVQRKPVPTVWADQPQAPHLQPKTRYRDHRRLHVLPVLGPDLPDRRSDRGSPGNRGTTAGVMTSTATKALAAKEPADSVALSAATVGSAFGHDSPAIRRGRLGRQFPQLRQASALRLEDAAATIGVAPSTLSRIETGQTSARTSYVRILLDLYGVSDPQQRRHLTDLAREGQRKDLPARLRDLLPAATRRYLGLEAAASHFRRSQPGPGIQLRPGI